MRGIAATVIVLFAGATLFAQGTKITSKGSDTMVILAQRWAETYMSTHKGTTIQVTGGGSGTGISALINGTTDICNSSRPIKPSERQKLKEKFGSGGVEVKCAIDGLSVYVHELNPVTELTLEQVREIFKGNLTNWKQVGGPDAGIILYSRENNSGTYVYFKDEVLLGENFSPRAQHMPGTAAVVNAVSKDRFSIGYGGVAYGKGIKDLNIRKDADSPAYPPTMENIKNGSYPISRFLYLYLRQKPTGELKNYVDWILSEEGQGVVSTVGYIPIR
jgi:phosphate transport system substrate-binding protein